MKIQREINGISMEFELTDDELWSAFQEKEQQFDRQDIEDAVCGLEDEDIDDLYGVSREVLESLFDQMAYEKRRNQDRYDMGWEFARDEAIQTVIQRYKEGCYDTKSE